MSTMTETMNRVD